MPEHVLDDLDVDVGGSGERGGPVSQIVEADRRQPTLGGEAVELVADLVRLERLPIGPGEHQVVANMRVVDCVELDSLALLVSDEDTTAEAVESDRSFSGFRLGGVFVDVLANLKELCCDLEQAGFQVDVLPLGRYRLASAEAAEGDEVVQRVEPMGGGVLEEAGGLLGGPHQLRGVDRAFALGVGRVCMATVSGWAWVSVPPSMRSPTASRVRPSGAKARAGDSVLPRHLGRPGDPPRQQR